VFFKKKLPYRGQLTIANRRGWPQHHTFYSMQTGEELVFVCRQLPMRKQAQDWMTQQPVLSELHMGAQQRAEPQQDVPLHGLENKSWCAVLGLFVTCHRGQEGNTVHM
jgi:hypothetical protein